MNTRNKNRKKSINTNKVSIVIKNDVSDKTIYLEDLTNMILMPDYKKPGFQEELIKQQKEKEERSKENYKNYLKDLSELDERSKYTLVWDSFSKSYSKMNYQSYWREKELKEEEDFERKSQEILKDIQERMIDKLEEKKPWLFEEAYSFDEKLNVLHKYQNKKY